MGKILQSTFRTLTTWYRHKSHHHHFLVFFFLRGGLRVSFYQEKERVLVQSQMVNKSLRKGHCSGVVYLTLVRIHRTLRGKLRTLLLFDFFFLCSPNSHIHTGTPEAVHGSSSLCFVIHSTFNATRNQAKCVNTAETKHSL